MVFYPSLSMNLNWVFWTMLSILLLTDLPLDELTESKSAFIFLLFSNSLMFALFACLKPFEL